MWYHAAASYDGTTWRLYLNGVLEAQTNVGSFTPRSDSIQHAALASALDSTGVAAGFFNGTIDEARIWDVVRTGTEIAGSMGAEVSSAAGLIGRWGLNEGFGTVTEDSTASVAAGTLTNGPAWVAGSPFAHTPLPPGNYALDFTGTAAVRDYVTFGPAPALGATTSFTLETWFRRDGAGVGVTTGTGGITERHPARDQGRRRRRTAPNTINANYFLGIDATTGVLVADYEEPHRPEPPGQRHGRRDQQRVASRRRHLRRHDGTWKLYLDGVLDRTLVLSSAFQPQAEQHPARRPGDRPR